MKKINFQEMKSSKYRGILPLFFVGCLSITFSDSSLGGPRWMRPKGDYIIKNFDPTDPQSGNPQSFYPNPNRKMTDFVEGCGNSPTFEKGIGQLMPVLNNGRDGRCPVKYGKNAPSLDRSLYGAVSFFEDGETCFKKKGGPCNGSGQLVVDQDKIITAGHTFLDERTGKVVDGKTFSVWVNVYVPVRLRENPEVAFEPRRYRVKDIHFQSLNPKAEHSKDIAFVTLSEPVGKFVGRMLEDGREIDRELVPREFWLKPLSFKPLGDAHFGVDVYTAGFHGDLEGGPHKNCEQNRLFRHRNGQNDLLAFNGDVMGMASGSAISVKGKGDELSLAAVLIGQIGPEGSSDYEGEFDVKTRFNYAVNADIFYDDFMAYRRIMASPKSI